MRKFVMALAVLAGMATAIPAANAGSFCTTSCNGNQCYTICR